MTRINRQTRPAKTPLTGVPPAVRNQVRAVPLLVEQLNDGSLRFSTASARGWSVVARDQFQILRALQGAFQEAQRASYARFRGEVYDLDAATEELPGDPLAPPQRPLRNRRYRGEVGYAPGQRRPDTADPDAWQKQPDGAWLSPAGRRYPPTSEMAQRVVRRRREAGLPT